MMDLNFSKLCVNGSYLLFASIMHWIDSDDGFFCVLICAVFLSVSDLDEELQNAFYKDLEG